MPVVAPRLSGVCIHALLYDGPLTIVRNYKAMQVKIESVLDGGAVNFGDQPTRQPECIAVKPRTLRNQQQFLRRPARVLAFTPAHMKSQFSV